MAQLEHRRRKVCRTWHVAAYLSAVPVGTAACLHRIWAMQKTFAVSWVRSWGPCPMWMVRAPCA